MADSAPGYRPENKMEHGSLRFQLYRHPTGFVKRRVPVPL